jgi:hypothetical protein
LRVLSIPCRTPTVRENFEQKKLSDSNVTFSEFTSLLLDHRMRRTKKSGMPRGNTRITCINIDTFHRPLAMNEKGILDWKCGVRHELRTHAEMLRTLAYARYGRLDGTPPSQWTGSTGELAEACRDEAALFGSANDTPDLDDFDPIPDDAADPAE